MSLYATWLDIDDDNHELHCARWKRTTKAEAEANREGGFAVDLRGRHYVPVPDAACTCGEEAPIIYQGSHVNPSGTDPRGGFVMVCAIPDFCHPDAIRNRDDDHGKPVNFLRLSVREDPATYRGNEPGDATVVLTREQVVEMHDTLARWLDVHPAPTSEVAPEG